jgi:LAO/AO transport system kinase
VAVLAIDPSSSRTGGSILGDKTRMETLSRHANAYIRPSPAGKTLGGVARKTREAITLCEAAGYDRIIVETVGVGQSETAVHQMTDYFLLLKLAGAGDDLQGIKKGIIEMADAIVINKADGDNLQPALKAKRAFKSALQLLGQKETIDVLTCSALQNDRINEVAETIEHKISKRLTSGKLQQLRQNQNYQWMINTAENQVLDDFYSDVEVKSILAKLKTRLYNGEITSFQAAEELIKAYQSS